MNSSADWVQYVLGRRAIEPAGFRFNYNSGGVILIGAALSAASGQDLVAFAQDALFSPLGISSFRWTRNPVRPEQVHTGGGLAMSARDQAKIGELFAADGMWQGRRILSSDWIRASTSTHTTGGGREYGYLWWLRPPPASIDAAEAWGTRGQHVFAVSSLHLVVVVNAHDDERDRGRDLFAEIVGAAAP